MTRTMHWTKKGVIFTAAGQYPWMQSHTQHPTVDLLEDRWRVYFGTRDAYNRSVVAFADVDAKNPSKVLYVHDRPVLDLGAAGCFDDSGVIPSWIVTRGKTKWLYYIGVNVGTTVPYRNAIGVAFSDDGGESYHRIYSGPVVDRTHLEPHLNGSSCVLIEENVWRMWYLSGLRWETRDGKPEPFYNIKHSTSHDGLVWNRRGEVCIDLKSVHEGALARPCVVPAYHCYRMWFCYRHAEDYRTNRAHSYRIGYAESRDGKQWLRNDELAGIGVSDAGWDSEMIAYPYVFESAGNLFMFYNGNGFGKSGFGYAVLERNVVDGGVY